MDHAPERDSSKRPAEEHDVKGCPSLGELFDGADAEGDVSDAAVGLLPRGLIDARPIRIDAQYGRRPWRVLKREPAIAAADLEDVLAAEARKSLDEPKFEALARIGR